MVSKTESFWGWGCIFFNSLKPTPCSQFLTLYIRGSGTVFSFIIKDTSGEIKICAFNSKCDEVYEYCISYLSVDS